MPHGHRTAELRSLAYHGLVAGRLDDALLARARARLATLPTASAAAWARLLDGPRADLEAALRRDDERMRDLRQDTPFAGELANAERWRILAEVRQVRRDQLEHVVRASADLTEDDEIVVVGSQAILGAHPDAPPALLSSVDADVFPRTHPERADVIEGAIGEGSPFHATFGYYAHAVGPATAKAPAGWEERLVAVRNANTRGATGLCLEPHDLVLAKLVAGREKDTVYGRTALRAGLVGLAELERRAADLEAGAAAARVSALLAAWRSTPTR